MSEENLNQLPQEDAEIKNVIHVSGMYENYFLDYASYVILERAIPSIQDGLKPVQRRILHAMNEMDDGRFNKVANIIGQTMQYHPHGDAAIGEAMINLGQKDLLIETQGNWGDINTGDSAAAPRYIEARLSKFAKEVVFSADVTNWQISYDGRKKEPITLPVKFPLVLAQGVDGIAVGLSTKILPHNFVELIKASIDHLKNKKISLFPDFLTGGMMDVTNYNEGQKGGKVRVRAKIDIEGKGTLVIRQIPFSTTTSSITDSIVKANDQGKIKIKKILDNTASEVEIVIELPSGTSPDVTIDALYAFTECETSISPNNCVIVDDKPQFLSVNDLLKKSTAYTVELLQKELEISRKDLLEKLHFSSLEKIFIEKRIYRNIEECETWEEVIATIDKGLKPFKKQFVREVTQEDIIKLTEIKIKRISKFDSFKADAEMKKLKESVQEAEHNLSHLTEYAIKYFEQLLEKYGKGKERKTEIRVFDTIQATQVAAANQKLYINRTEGFIGFGIKKDEFVCDCFDIDDIIVFRKDGKYLITKIGEKKFVGKDIIHIAVWNKGDERMVYNSIHLDGESGISYVKRFNVTGITRDKEYDITKGTKNSKVLYFTSNANSEAEIISVQLSQGCSARNKLFDFNFSELDVKGRSSQGNILTKYPVKKVIKKSAGVSTAKGRDIWLDETIGKLNTDQKGKYLGNFEGNDLILIIYNDGNYELNSIEFSKRFEAEQIQLIEKYNPEKAISAIYMDGEDKQHYVKRFKLETSSANKKFVFISEHPDSKLILASTADNNIVKVTTQKGKSNEELEINLTKFIDVKGWKAIGNKLSFQKVKKIQLIESYGNSKDLEQVSIDDGKQLGIF